jgi:branched-chain amino acid aminotransferase
MGPSIIYKRSLPFPITKRTLVQGGRFVFLYSKLEEMSVAITSWQRISGNALPARTKATAAYLNSALASLEVLQNGFDEALFLTDKGYICEGPGENIFMVKNGKLITPPPSDDILEGITRDTVMRIAKEEFGIDTVERSISRAEIYGGDEVFFSGTAMEITPIVYIDRRVIGCGKTGLITMQIKDIYMTITKGKNPKYLEYCRPVY